MVVGVYVIEQLTDAPLPPLSVHEVCGENLPPELGLTVQAQARPGYRLTTQYDAKGRSLGQVDMYATGRERLEDMRSISRLSAGAALNHRATFAQLTRSRKRLISAAHRSQ